MRGFRSTFILLVVFLGLLGYVYFYGEKKPLGKDAGEPKQKVFTVEADKIEELQVKPAKGDRSVLKKVNGAWTMVEPAQTKADESEVTSIATNLASLERQRVVDDNPADISQYGLATPRVEVAFRKSGDKDVTRLFLGEKTPTGGDLYAKLPTEKRVFLVSSFLDGTFNRTAFDLRDKKVLVFDREKASALEVVSKDGPVTLALVDTRWQVTKPIAARADASAVDGAIGRIQTAQMKSFVADDVPEKDLAKYGLDKPDVTVTVVSGSVRATLAIGKGAEGGNLYARDVSRPMVFTVEAALATDLKKKADDYRPRDLFEFKPFTITRLEITRGAATVAFEKSKSKDGAEKWRRVGQVKDLDQPNVDALLSSLSSIVVDKYVDSTTKTGIGSPVAVVVAKFDDGKKEEKVTFGKVGSDVFAARSGDAGAAQIAATKLDDMLKSLDALK
ncbi:MAG: DUF4340 domain-containing protein [Acidobacteria bacterium]|nr:DUF4340 domain-containing protein [Acidobacteriota bacterium]